MFYLFILLILMGMLLKKSNIYTFLIIIFVAILVFLGTNVPDMNNYSIIYKFSGYGKILEIEKGWYFLCYIGTKLHLNYIQFKTIIAIIATLIITKSIKYFINDGERLPFFLALYLTFPLLLDLIQIKFFLAEAIVLFGLRFLISNKKSSTLLYIGIILIAYTIHSSSLFYLILLLYKFLKKNNEKYIIIGTFVAFILSIFKNKIISLMTIIIKNERLINRYMYKSKPPGTIDIIIDIIVIAVFFYFSKGILNKNDNLKLKDKEKNFLECNYKFNILFCMVLPLTMIDNTFFRVQRIAWITMYISLVILLKNKIKSISVFKVKIPIKFLGPFLALLGNLLFISIKMPYIIFEFFHI